MWPNVPTRRLYFSPTAWMKLIIFASSLRGTVASSRIVVGDSRAHGRRRRVHAREGCEQRFFRARLRHELQQNFRDDPERALGADEHVLHRITGDIFHALAAEPDDAAVREHDFEAHHVVARD